MRGNAFVSSMRRGLAALLVLGCVGTASAASDAWVAPQVLAIDESSNSSVAAVLVDTAAPIDSATRGGDGWVAVIDRISGTSLDHANGASATQGVVATVEFTVFGKPQAVTLYGGYAGPVTSQESPMALRQATGCGQPCLDALNQAIDAALDAFNRDMDDLQEWINRQNCNGNPQCEEMVRHVVEIRTRQAWDIFMGALQNAWDAFNRCMARNCGTKPTPFPVDPSFPKDITFGEVDKGVTR